MKKKISLSCPVGIIDVGSNSVRLLLTDGIFFEKSVITTMLGKGLNSSKYLNVDAIMKTANAVKTLSDKAKEGGATNVFVFATAAVRESLNGKEFIDIVKRLTSLDVDVVSGDKEAELGVLGALNGEVGGIIDIGGASTEIAYFDGKELVYKKSLPIGVVKLNSQFKQDRFEITKFIENAITDYGQVVLGSYKAIGGTATSLASIDLGLKVYDRRLTDGHYISTKRLQELMGVLYGLSPQKICDNYAIQPLRADTIAGGCTLLYCICKYLNLDGVTISEKDNLEGYLNLLKDEK